MDNCIYISDDEEVEVVDQFITCEPIIIDLTESDTPVKPANSRVDSDDHDQETNDSYQDESEQSESHPQPAPGPTPPPPPTKQARVYPPAATKPVFLNFTHSRPYIHLTPQAQQRQAPPFQQPPLHHQQNQQQYQRWQHAYQHWGHQKPNIQQRKQPQPQQHEQQEQHPPQTRPEFNTQQQQSQQDQTESQQQQENRQQPDHQIHQQAKEQPTQLSDRDVMLQKKELGNKRYRTNQLNEAIKLYREASDLARKLEDKEMMAILHFNLAMTYSKLGSYNQAADECAAAVKIDNNYMKAHCKRAEIYMSQEKFDEAVICYEYICELDSTKRDEAMKRIALARELSKNCRKLDQYEILGLQSNFSIEELRKNYRKKARAHHPDRHSDADVVTRRIQEKIFKEASEAYAFFQRRYGFH